MTGQTLDLQTLSRRIEKLERQNRRLRLVGCLTMLLMSAFLLMGQALPKSKVIEAENFRLIDSAGNKRAELSIKEEEPILSFYYKGQLSLPAVEVGLEHQRTLGYLSPMLTLRSNKIDGSYVVLDLYKDGTPRLSLLGLKHHIVMDNESLQLFDNSKIRSVVGSKELQTKSGTNIKLPSSSLVLFNAEGEVIWKAPPNY